MPKTIIGLDIGTTSIGFAVVKEAQDGDIQPSQILKIGVRVNPLSADEKDDFNRGKSVSINKDRTLKRGARRNLQRYKQRRLNLRNILTKAGLINANTVLVEDEKNSTHTTWALRSKAATERVELDEFVRLLFMLNKKRGYKSSRKAKNEDEGQLIDGMEIAKLLHKENITPGELCLRLLKEGKKSLPDFYRSDLAAEFDSVWNQQAQFYPEVFTPEFKKDIEGKGQKATSAAFWKRYEFNTAENKGTRDEKKLRAYQWRSDALSKQLKVEEAAYAITEINSDLNSSSGYLGEISDRSKELFFNNQTVGQYLYAQLKANPHTRMKNQVFYRQDYLTEFETLWATQAQYHPQLTNELRNEVRDIVIFYQRKLKSQKGLVSFCEFESKTIETTKDGNKAIKTIGLKVAPKSSPLFQEFKIWQNLNHLEIRNKKSKEIKEFDAETKQALFDELNIKGNLKADAVLKFLNLKPSEWELNFTALEGNRTSQVLYAAYLKMMEQEGHDDIDSEKLPADEIKAAVKSFFETQNINAKILEFDALAEGKAFEQQPAYILWHLLYSYEGDNSNIGNDKLYSQLEAKFGFSKQQAQLLANASLQQDYGNLSAKALRKIVIHIKDVKYSEACKLAGYNHSSYLTAEENAQRELKPRLDLLAKGSLRNPVVEKILNQMVNVVNAIMADPELGQPDEIRIELARELKKNAKEREEMTAQINKATAEHDAIRLKLIREFGVKNPTRNDIIRYKLWDELKFNGYHDLYTNEYISPAELFSNKYDVDHIIPQSRVFDDSFSNKVLVPRKINLDKGNFTAIDYITNEYDAQKVAEYKKRLDAFLKAYPERKAKYKKLLITGAEIGEGFIERDLRDSQYIAKKAKAMLHEICRSVVTTTGSITERLRRDWDLVNVMQELNMEKYRAQGLTEMIERKDGQTKERITDWTKRNDHRHHAMDALTIAFTKHSHIQYLNHLNARQKNDKFTDVVFAIENKETRQIKDDNGNRKRIFNEPLKNFREEAKKHLENVLVSYKAKNKVVTKNKNKAKISKDKTPQTALTPRGQLHKETVYGKIKQPVTSLEKVSSKFNEHTINQVTKPAYRQALLKRLHENGNDATKAFTGKNSLPKNPIYLDEQKTMVVPEKVLLSWLEDDYTIRKSLSPDNFKDKKSIDKVIDVGVRNILLQRLHDFNDDAKAAFSDLDKNPVWLNEEKGIAIKRVTISGVKNADPLHFKKDHYGNEILQDGKPVPADFISTGNNHHVAIYRDENGNLQDEVISLYKVITERVNFGLPVIDKTYNRELDWKFLFTMKQNEYFIFPTPEFDPTAIDLLDPANNALISPNLFRVQKFSKLTYGNSAVREYMFRHHLETSVDDKKELKDVAYKAIKSLPYLENIVKVRINHIGQIVKVGEY